LLARSPSTTSMAGMGRVSDERVMPSPKTLPTPANATIATAVSVLPTHP
jgi:hypothetical protein